MGDEQIFTNVVDNILYTLTVQRRQEGEHLIFSTIPMCHMIIHYSDGTDWHKELFSNSITLENVKKYYITYGLTQQMAQIYMTISPPKPITQPRFYRMPDNTSIIACSAKNWFRIYNNSACNYYIYSDTMEPPVVLHPKKESMIYTYDTDIIVRKENNYTQLSIRDLTQCEKDNLIPCDLVVKHIYNYTRWSSINWMLKQDYQWMGTLSLIKENDTNFDCIFTDGTTNFTYPILYVKKILKHIIYGKITGTFIFEPIISGSHIRYIPMPVRKKKHIAIDMNNTEFIID